jgi:branched-chain amino acid transport system substrate-binding protein
MRFVRTAAVMAVALAVAGCQKKQEAQAPAAPAAGTAAVAGDTALIGLVTPRTGDLATFGESTERGVLLAIEEANAAGGVKGKKLAVKTYDSQGKPEEAAVAATRLIAQEKVVALIGEVASSGSLAMAPIADTNRVPMVSSASTNPRVTKDGEKTRPYVFRVCFIDPFQGTVIAKFARETLKAQKVAILRDVGNDYSVGLADYFQAKVRELGGEVVSDQSFKAGDQDFKAQLTAIKAKKPEMLYVPAYYTDVALIGRQARELGIKVPLAGGDGWDSSKLYEIAQGALDGGFFSNHYTHENPSPVIQGFVKKYQEKYGSVPDALAALGYDAAKMTIDAMTRATELSGPAIRDALEATKGLAGVTGSITLDPDHNPVKSAVVLGVEKNAPKYVSTVEP